MNNDQGVSGKQSADGDGVVNHHLSREQAPSRCVPYRPDTSSHHPLPPSLQSKQWYGIAVKANWSILGKGGLWCAPGYNLSQSWIQSCQCSEPELMLVFTIKSVILRPLKKNHHKLSKGMWLEDVLVNVLSWCPVPHLSVVISQPAYRPMWRYNIIPGAPEINTTSYIYIICRIVTPQDHQQSWLYFCTTRLGCRPVVTGSTGAKIQT